ncbi:MAG: hypothetical protein ACR2F1_07915 [Nitrososphaeraceae archaeon]
MTSQNENLNNEKESIHSCPYSCDTNIFYKGKQDGKGSMGWFEIDNPDIEHTFTRCIQIRTKKGIYKPKKGCRAE